MRAKRKVGSIEERFWPKVDKGPHPKGCWLWTACLNAYGYGQMGTGNGRMIRAHRASYIIANGSIPEKMFVLHRCDTRACVNPDHLVVGNQADNMHHMSERGRARSSELMGEVDQIKGLRDEGMTWKTIGSIYGITGGGMWTFFNRHKHRLQTA